MRCGIAASGWPRFPNPGFACERNGSISNWICCKLCIKQRDATLVAKATGIRAVKLLRQIPSIGPIRAALLLALFQTPHRFRTKRQLWAYGGSPSKLTTAASTATFEGSCSATGSASGVRGLRGNYNRDLKNLFKSTAISASTRPGPLRDFYEALLAKGMRPTVAGTPHPSQENRCHYFNRLEERGGLRRQTIRSASNLSISERVGSPSLVLSQWWSVGFWRRSIRGQVSVNELGRCLLRQRVTNFHAMPPRIIRNSDRPRASDRTRWFLPRRHQSRLRSLLGPIGMVATGGKPKRRGKPSRATSLSESGTLVQTVGWISRHKSSRPPVKAEVFS